MYLHRHTQLFDQYRHSPPETRRRPRTSARDRCRIRYIVVARRVSTYILWSRKLTIASPARPAARKERAGRRKLLNAIIVCIGNIDVTQTINRNSPRRVKLSVTSAVRSPLSYERSTRVEFLNAIIAGVSYINVVGQISGDSFWSTATTRQQEAHRESTSISCFLKQPRVLSEGRGFH